jgi:hypothetical protein
MQFERNLLLPGGLWQRGVHVLANRHQLAEASDRLTVDPQRHVTMVA